MNYSLILFLICLVTGVLWLLDRAIWRRQRPEGAPRPGWLEYTAGFFPLLFAIFLLRSFAFEPFNIPSGSMIPTLRIGDMILVQKYSYGVRLPIVHTKVLDTGSPKRGDVAVFRYPKDTGQDYIKRIVGLPGDEIRYENKVLSINGTPVSATPAGAFMDPTMVRPISRFEERLGEKRYFTLVDADVGNGFLLAEAFPFRDQCQRTAMGMVCRVPQGHYFGMGDNRDNSADSRVWGFIPERNLAGRAVLVWFNASEVFDGNFSRLGWIE